LAELYTGNSISESEKRAKYTNVEGVCYIGTKDVSFNHKIDYENGIAVPPKYISKFKIAPAESILLCVEGGSAGKKIAFTHHDVCFGNKLCCFAFFAPSSADYAYYYLQSASFYDSFSSNVTGIIGGVGAQRLKNLLLPLPPIDEQQRIVAQIEKLFEQLR
jgi:type I restriction enzyme, S subunit